MREEERQRAIRQRLSGMVERAPADLIPTPFAGLNLSLGGGLPRGRIVELFGASASGKTALALQTVARAQTTGSTAAWIDADHTFDPVRAGKLGVALEKLPLAGPDSAEQAIEIARRLCLSGAIDLLVIDSAAALVPRLELDAGIGAGGQGLHARVLASGLRTLSRTIARTGSVVLVLNQIRNRVESTGGEVITSAGGPALKLYAAVRIRLGPVAGKRVRFRVLKNKTATGLPEGELAWNPGTGFTESP